MRRFFLLAGLSLLLVASAVLPSGAQTQGEGIPTVIQLPDGWLPEGVETGLASTLYAGSRFNGAIYATDLLTGESHIAVPGQTGRIAVGLAFDARTNFIFVAGGGGGAGYVYDAATGESQAAYAFTTAPTFINDVVVTSDAAYFTESQKPVIFKVPLGLDGALPPPDGFETIPLSGDYVHMTGLNLNGIVATADGEHLVVVQSGTGKLFDVDPDTGVANEIDLGGYSVSAGDGLLLEERTLFVVRNNLNLLAIIELSQDLTTGDLVAEVRDPRFDVPTTLARFGTGLYVVNARFSTPARPSTTYTIVRVER